MPYRPGMKYEQERKIIAAREYNRSRPARHKFYSTSQWRRLREYKRRCDPLCEECLRHGVITQGELVDHIIPIEAGGSELDIKNLQTLCNSCHNKKHGGGGIENFRGTNLATGGKSA